jgi:hypothetical protein
VFGPEPADTLDITGATTPTPEPTNALNQSAATTPTPEPTNALNQTAATTSTPEPTNALNQTAATTSTPDPAENELKETLAKMQAQIRERALREMKMEDELTLWGEARRRRAAYWRM